MHPACSFELNRYSTPNYAPMQSRTEIVSAITARLHALISEDKIHEARTVFRQLNAKEVWTPELETLRAWFRMKTLQYTTRELAHNPTEPSRWLRQFESLWALKREREAVEVLIEGLHSILERSNFTGGLFHNTRPQVPMKPPLSTAKPHSKLTHRWMICSKGEPTWQSFVSARVPPSSLIR